MRDPIRDLRAYAADLETEVPVERARARVARILDDRPVRVPRRRAAVAMASSLFLGVSNLGLAAAANPSIPGDALYGIDRAYERLESLVGVDHRIERLDEATALLAAGRAQEALSLVREALGPLADAGSADEARALLVELQESSGVDVTELQKTVDALIAAAQAVSEVAGSDAVKDAATRIADSATDVSTAAKELAEQLTTTLPSDTRPENPSDTRPTSSTTPSDTRPTSSTNPSETRPTNPQDTRP